MWYIQNQIEDALVNMSIRREEKRLTLDPKYWFWEKEEILGTNIEDLLYISQLKNKKELLELNPLFNKKEFKIWDKVIIKKWENKKFYRKIINDNIYIRIDNENNPF